MKRDCFILSLIAIFIYAHSFAQPVIKYQRTLGGSADDNFSCMDRTSDGGLIAGGTSYSGISRQKTDTSRGGADYWIIKFNNKGNKLWDKTFGGNANDMLTAVQQTSDGGYILGGYSYSNKSGEKSEDRIGFPDYWIVKLDNKGNKQWDKTIGIADESGFDYGIFLKSLQQVRDGGYILAGVLGGDDDYSEPVLLVKLDSLGNTEWDTTFGGEVFTAVVQQTADDGYILGGSNYNRGIDEEYYYAYKLDKQGKTEWNKIYNIAEGYLSTLTALVQLKNGGYLLGGYSDGDKFGVKTEYSRGGYDYWLLEIDSSGNVKGDKTIGGSNNDNLSSMYLTDDGGIILGGYSTSNASAEKTENNRGGDDDNDYWVVKLDSLRNIQWDKTVGGTEPDYLYSIKQVAPNQYVLGGYSSSGKSGDKTQPSRGGNDYWGVVLDYILPINLTADQPIQASDYTPYQKSKGFTAYPNPTKDRIIIQSTGKATYTLMNTEGKVVAAQTLNGNSVMHVANLPAGIYYLKNTTSGETKKIVIEK
jgi:hypothetical protein